MAAIVVAVAKRRSRDHEGLDEHNESSDRHTTTHSRSGKNLPVEVLDDPTRKMEEPVPRIQRFMREKVLCRDKRLHRKNLAERLTFESETTLGLLRFFNQLMVFALFVAALAFSSNQEATRGILETLDAEFDFEAISDVSRRDQFVKESMHGISEKSKDFFILSNKYFDDQGVGATQLIKDITLFTEPALSAPISIQVLEFSFTAWVKIMPQFVDGYVVRKRLVPEGAGANLACWGWYVSATNGPELHYGCHDFFEPASNDLQVAVGLATPAPTPADQFAMLTLVVDESRAHFYRNTDYLGAAPLPRPFTDCFNDGEGLLVGSSGMSLSLLRFHPRALTLSSIEEIFQGGSLLADISTGSEPLDAQPEGLQGVLTKSMDEVKDTVHARQDASEVTMVLKSVKDERANPQVMSGAFSDPVDAPLGSISAASNTTADPLTAKSYFQLARGPWRLSPTLEAADHRSIVNLPDAAGKGFSYTWWYRHMPCEKSTCGLFMFSTRDDTRPGPCIEVWLETVGIWWNNVLAEDGNSKFQYPTNFVADRFELNDDFSWRHIAFVFDETSDEVRFYLDGQRAFTGPWGSPVTGADCTGGGKFMTLGRWGPLDYTYGADVDIYDFRQYVHDSGPLSDAEVFAIASAETPELNPAQKCLSIDSPSLADSGWRDEYGHDCEWYFANKEAYPTICELSDAARECPVACASRQECLSTEEPAPVFLTWDRIRRVESVGPNGTLCLASSIDPEQVLSECRAWAEAHISEHGDLSKFAADFEAWTDSMLIARRGRRLNLTSCEELAASIDPGCAFDEQAVKDFSAASLAHGGDFTISFWIRPTGKESEIPETGTFVPTVQFLGSISPPQHNLAIGLWSNPFGEARVFSACDRSDRDIYDNIEIAPVDADGWTMISISRKSTNDADGKLGACTTVTNIARNTEGSQLTQCLYDPAMFMNAIEINYPVLITPIMMVPKALALAEMQQMYFTSAESISVRSGPMLSNSARVSETTIGIDKRDYSPRSILMAPPILFQTKTEPAEECPFTYSTKLIEEEHKKMGALKCTTPFECTQEVLEDKFLLYACPGERVTGDRGRTDGSSRVFGLEPKDFNGNKGYADFLYSIVDHPILARDGELRQTEDFINSRTEMAQVILVFFTPDAGTTSVMTATADFSGYSAATVSVSLQHYEILEGDAKWTYLSLQVLVLVNLVLMAIDVFLNLKSMLQQYREDGETPAAPALAKQLVDLVTIGMCVAFIVMRIPQKFATASETESIVGGLSRIPWDSVDVSLEQKTSEFFALSTRLLGLIADEQNLNRFCNVILLISLLRVVQCTSLHPRLALLTGTIAKSFDDMWHSCILVVLLMGCFAAVASWRFGGYREDFGNFERSMQTQFEMLFGEFPDDWTESRDMQAYSVLYIIIMFLLIQNFLLAIIVEAYMKVREHNEKMKTHQEITTDVIGCAHAYISAWTHGWPTPGRMGRLIGQWEAKFSVGFRDIYSTGEFKSQAAVSSWLDHYMAYEFLEPEEVGRFGYEDPEEKIEDKIESRLKRVVGKELPLRERAQAVIRNSSLAQTPRYRRLSIGTNPVTPATPRRPSIESPSKGGSKPMRRRSSIKIDYFGDDGGGPALAPAALIKTDRALTPTATREAPSFLRADLVHTESSQNFIQRLQAQIAVLQAKNARLEVESTRRLDRGASDSPNDSQASPGSGITGRPTSGGAGPGTRTASGNGNGNAGSPPQTVNFFHATAAT